MKNQLKYVNRKEVEKILENTDKKDCYILELDGRNIIDWEDYDKQVSEILEFPRGYKPHNIEAYVDWMTDLDWLHKESYIVVIYHFSECMREYPKDKELLIETFEESILPFWEDEVIYTVCEGYPKLFNVYLVD